MPKSSARVNGIIRGEYIIRSSNEYQNHGGPRICVSLFIQPFLVQSPITRVARPHAYIAGLYMVVGEFRRASFAPSRQSASDTCIPEISRGKLCVYVRIIRRSRCSRSVPSIRPVNPAGMRDYRRRACPRCRLPFWPVPSSTSAVVDCDLSANSLPRM